MSRVNTQTDATTPGPAHTTCRATVPPGYNNLCGVCTDTFCSSECEDSFVFETGTSITSAPQQTYHPTTDASNTPLGLTPMQTVDVQYETSEHPMSNDLYNTLSSVRGFTNINGATYTAYVANWEIRRQCGILIDN